MTGGKKSSVENIDTSLVAGYDLKVGDFCELSMALFAVLLGYEYDSLKEKNIQYGMKRIWGLLKIYWLSLIFLELPLLLMGTDEEMFVLAGFLQNLVGFSILQEWHLWFGFLFIMAMLLLPYLCRVFEKNLWAGRCGSRSRVSLYFICTCEALTELRDELCSAGFGSVLSVFSVHCCGGFACGISGI